MNLGKFVSSLDALKMMCPVQALTPDIPNQIGTPQAGKEQDQRGLVLRDSA